MLPWLKVNGLLLACAREPVCGAAKEVASQRGKLARKGIRSDRVEWAANWTEPLQDLGLQQSSPEHLGNKQKQYDEHRNEEHTPLEDDSLFEAFLVLSQHTISELVFCKHKIQKARGVRKVNGFVAGLPLLSIPMLQPSRAEADGNCSNHWASI